MRRVLVATGAALALCLAFAGGAQAKCSVTCLNHKVTQLASAVIKDEKKIASLSKTVSQQGQTIAAQGQTITQQGAAIAGLTQGAKLVASLAECLFEVPLNQYGEPGTEGYLYENATETFQTTALDVVPKGETVGAWFLIDGCNTITTASVKAAARRFR
jgi:uncharacterized Zn-binding protein involved in type VI secretion